MTPLLLCEVVKCHTSLLRTSGNIVDSSGSTTNPYRYVGSLGYYADDISGLMHVGARYYNPKVGRFWTQDPPGKEANWYVYAGNNVSASVDPTGLQYELGPYPGNDLLVAKAYEGMCKLEACFKKWGNWWVRNHPWDKKHSPRYGIKMDKVAHCFVTCKVIKECGSRTDALIVARLKEIWDWRTGGDYNDMPANMLGADIAGQKNSNCLPDCLKAVDKKYGGVPKKYLNPNHNWGKEYE
jgi:RHS repeat-associated protein